MKICDRLLKETEDIWRQYYTHPFVLGIQNGDLSKEKFRHYIIQDYLYLIDYARTFAVGIAKAKSSEMRRLFTSYVNMLVEGEMDIHRGYMGQLGISLDEIEKTPTSIDNLSYTSYMLRVAYEDGETEIMAAILSCAYSYEVIAKNMVKNRPQCVDDDFYGEWVKGYISERYHNENAMLMETLEKLAADYTPRQIQHLVDIFRACSVYELMFWDMGWQMKK